MEAHPRTPILDAPPYVRYGLPDVFTGDSPAAGADFLNKIGGTFAERLLTVFCRLVCSADVANREVVLEYLDNAGNRFYVAGAATVAVADTTVDYCFDAFRTVDTFTVDGSVLVPMAPIILQPTQAWRLHVVNIDNTDQLSRIRYSRERFYTTDHPSTPAPHSGT